MRKPFFIPQNLITMAYGKIAASWMYPQTGKNPIDQRVKDTLGFKRLKKDLDQLNLRWDWCFQFYVCTQIGLGIHRNQKFFIARRTGKAVVNKLHRLNGIHIG